MLTLHPCTSPSWSSSTQEPSSWSSVNTSSHLGPGHSDRPASLDTFNNHHACNAGILPPLLRITELLTVLAEGTASAVFKAEETKHAEFHTMNTENQVKQDFPQQSPPHTHCGASSLQCPAVDWTGCFVMTEVFNLHDIVFKVWPQSQSTNRIKHTGVKIRTKSWFTVLWVMSDELSFPGANCGWNNSDHKHWRQMNFTLQETLTAARICAVVCSWSLSHKQTQLLLL